jgi:transposase
MSKNTKFIGIDISKKVFDVWCEDFGHKQFNNTYDGFDEFSHWLYSESWCVMEYTGSYYQQLAIYLYENGISVSVVNPLVVKRYCQMKMQHNKTDRIDAKMLASYGKEQGVTQWSPNPDYIIACKDMHTTITLYFRQSTALKNKLLSLQDKGVKGKLLTSVKRQIRNIQKEIKLLEQDIEALVCAEQQELVTNLKTIPGIGKKTAIMLIVTTNCFNSFDNAGQVSAFFGLSPVETSSGTTIRGRSRISKRGNPVIRNYLFMCSFTASHKNPQCKALYDRIVAKGKSKKLALIAVTNKLLKQAFAIAKSRVRYHPDFKSVLAHK